MKRIAVLIIMLFGLNVAFSQSLNTEDGIKNWETNFQFGLNNDGYQTDFGISCFPLQFIGIKAQIGLASEIEEFVDWGKSECETHHHYASRFKFTPALVLRSPCIINWKKQEAGFYLFAEPGIILSDGATDSKHPEHFNWDFKCGINLQLDRFIVCIGYGISDFSLYSGFPRNHWGSPSSDKYITHSGFVGGAYKF